MRKVASVIEINGNRYDALTGQLIGVVKKVTRQDRGKSEGVIDGFVRSGGGLAPKSSAQQPAQPSVAQASMIKAQKPRRSRLRHTAQAIHRRAQKSQTLMRTSVSKPKKPAKEAEIIGPKLQSSPAKGVDHSRASRAKAIAKSNHVSRFTGGRKAANPPDSTTYQVVAKTRIREPQTVPLQASNHSAEAAAQPTPSVVAGLTNSQLERLLDHALTKAGSHKETLKNRSGRSFISRIKIMPKWAAIGASVLIVVVLAGFFAWQNVPQASMRLASSRAGMPASVPGYTPPGFSFAGPITYSKGAVSIRYKAGHDGSKFYSVKQQKSTLDSQSLATSAIPAGSQVQTSDVNGTTIFIYGSRNDATWVNRGIQYTITDQAGLNSDQLLKIAGSL